MRACMCVCPIVCIRPPTRPLLSRHSQSSCLVPSHFYVLVGHSSAFLYSLYPSHNFSGKLPLSPSLFLPFLLLFHLLLLIPLILCSSSFPIRSLCGASSSYPLRSSSSLSYLHIIKTSSLKKCRSVMSLCLLGRVKI